MAGNPTFTQKLFKLPPAHLCENPGLPERQNAPPIEGQSQLAPDLTLGFFRGEPEGVDNI